MAADKSSSNERAGTVVADATAAVLAHSLVNVMSVVKATAATLRDHYDEISDQPELVKESLSRMARNADFAVTILEDLARGITIDLTESPADVDGRP